MSGADRHFPPFIRYSELIGMVVLFLGVLAFLYPRGTLEKQVLAERSNYDLTSRYLENLLKLEPANEALMMGLAKTAVNSGRDDLALHLLKLLEQKGNPKFLPQVLQLRYRLLERRLPLLPEEKRPQIRRELTILLQSIGKLDPALLEPPRYWLHQFLAHKDEADALRLVRFALKRTPDSLFWLREAFGLSLKNKEFRQARKYLHRLQKLDKGHEEIWLEQAYYLAVAQKEYDEAHRLLKRLERYSDKWTAQEAQMALWRGQYLQASLVYQRLYRESPSPKEKKKWLLKALDSLQQGGKFREAVTLAQKHEKAYLDDPQMVNRLLKLYLAAGDLEAASALSKRLLNRSMPHDR